MPWDRELAQLERAIRELTAGYDAFLFGSAAKPPIEQRGEIERAFRRLATQDPENAADGYRLSTLQTRYNTLCERWERLQSEKEAGRRPGVYSRFTQSGGETHASANVLPSESVKSSAGGSPSATTEKSGGAPGERELFERYIAAKKGRGEDVTGVDFARFADALECERQKIREKVGEIDVEFDLAERDGRVKLVARRKA